MAPGQLEPIRQLPQSSRSRLATTGRSRRLRKSASPRLESNYCLQQRRSSSRLALVDPKRKSGRAIGCPDIRPSRTNFSTLTRNGGLLPFVICGSMLSPPSTPWACPQRRLRPWARGLLQECAYTARGGPSWSAQADAKRGHALDARWDRTGEAGSQDAL